MFPPLAWQLNFGAASCRAGQASSLRSPDLVCRKQLRDIASGSQQLFDLRSQIRNSLRKLSGACRCFTQPKWNSRWLTFRIFDSNHAGIHAQNSPRRVAELEDITSQTFDGEIFVHGADERFRGLEDDAIVGVVGNRAAGSERGQSRPAPAADAMIDRVVMN